MAEPTTSNDWSKRVLQIIIAALTIIALACGALGYVHACVNGVRVECQNAFARKERVADISCNLQDFRDEFRGNMNNINANLGAVRQEQKADFKTLADMIRDSKDK